MSNPKTTTIEITVPHGYVLSSVVNGEYYSSDPATWPQISLLTILEYGAQRWVNDKTGGKTDTEKADIAAKAIKRLESGDVLRASTAGNPLAKWIDKAISLWLVAPANREKEVSIEYLKCEKAADRHAYVERVRDALSDKQLEAFTNQAASLKAAHDAEQARKAKERQEAAEALAANDAIGDIEL